jgi:hypothetical protein
MVSRTIVNGLRPSGISELRRRARPVRASDSIVRIAGLNASPAGANPIDGGASAPDPNFDDDHRPQHRS